MPRPRVVFLRTGGALHPQRYQASVLVEAAGATCLLDVGGGPTLMLVPVDPASSPRRSVTHRAWRLFLSEDGMVWEP